MTALPTARQSVDDTADGPFAWYRTLPSDGRRAFVGAFAGYSLDAYDFQVLPLGLTAIAAYFHLNKGQSGLLTTVTLVVSALGGILAGALIDRIGRTRTLMITVGTYAVFTTLCGFADSYPMLLTFRALQGLGFGGEWAAGAVLVAEYAQARYRGRTVAFVQASWAVGWGAAVVVATLALDHLGTGLSWRVVFWTGALPGLTLLYIRRHVVDAPVSASEGAARSERAPRVPLWHIFGRRIGRVTLFATLMSTGVQGGYYTIATWLPTYLKTERHLTIVGTGGYLSILITGAFIGYLCGGYLSDRMGRRAAIGLFGVLSGAILYTYVHIPANANHVLLLLGFPLGFCFSAIFSGFGAYLAELYPRAIRGTGQSFTYNVGRAVGAFFPTAVGFSAGSGGLGGALVYGTIGYALAVVALFGLPETRGSELR